MIPTLADFRLDLQGLRAIAVLLVILAHSGLDILPGGFIGVDVFFVLSGYLISGLLMRELKDNGRLDFIWFYARRLRRLLPALILMLSVISVAAIVLLSGMEARKQLASAPFAASWTSNLYFAFQKLDYFDELSTRDLFLHTWSLGVEEQFYLIWPAVLLVWHRALVPGIVVTFFASLALSLYWTLSIPQSAFYLMPSRIWQFCLGASVYLAFRNGIPKGLSSVADTARYSLLALAAGILLVIGSAAGLRPNLPYLGFWIIVPSVGAALVIAAGCALLERPERSSSPMAHPILVWIGNRSYSLYLWHWPVLILGFSMGFRGQVIPTLALVFLTFLAAALSFRYVELPFWKGRFSKAEPRRAVLAGVLCIFAVVLALNFGQRELQVASVNNDDLSNQWRMDLPIVYRFPCDAWFTHSRVEPCVLGPQTAKKTVVLLGDSIGMQWFSLLPALYEQPNWRTVVLTKSSCPLVDEDFFYERIGQNYTICSDWRKAVLDELDRLKPDVIVVGNAATYNFSKTQWVEGSARIMTRLSKAARNVFVIPGIPSLSFDGPGCVARHLAKGDLDRNVCLDTAPPGKRVDLVARYLEQAARRFRNVHMLNLNDLVCPGAQCNAIDQSGHVVFRDNQHLTDSFVRAQIPLVRDRLKEILQIKKTRPMGPVIEKSM